MNDSRIHRNMKIARDAAPQNSAAVATVNCHSIGKDIRANSYFFTRKAADLVSEACFTVMTGDRHD